MKIDNEMAASLFPLETLRDFFSTNGGGTTQHGDMPIKDLSPKDNNRGGRIIKNMRICGSGIYRYHVSEAAMMGLVLDAAHGDVEWIDVYRPAAVLERYKDLYARVPIITGSHVVVNTGNAKKLAVGMVGDSIKAEQGDDGETYLYATGTIIAGDGIAAYEDLGELSVGYDPIIEWKEGEHNGKRYNAVMTGITGVNHLLICKAARGGHQCTFMDSKPDLSAEGSGAEGSGLDRIITGGKAMGIFSRIFSTPAKQMNGDARVVSAMLQSIKAGADAKTQVTAIKEMVGDAADATLKGYFDDLMGDEVAKADKETLNKAIDVVDKYCQQALMGDEFPPPKDKKDDNKKDDDKPKENDDKKEPGDKKEDDKPANGDSGIDYEKLASLVADKLKPKEEQHGDENPITFSPIITHGDSKEGMTSDAILKDIYGGNDGNS